MRKTKRITKKRRRGRRLNRRGRFLLLGVALVLVLGLGVLWHNYLPYWLYPTPFYDEIVAEAKESDIDPKLVLAVARVESGFNPSAVSPVGAVGIMQLMPNTAEWLAGKLGEDYDGDMLTDPDYNIHIGTEYLRFLMDYWNWDVVKAVASYNAGQTKVLEWLNGGLWDGTLANAEQIPYQETRDYVKKVLEVYRQYNELY